MEIGFSIIEDLPGLVTMFECWADSSRDDGGIVEEIEDTAGMTSKNDLLLGTLNSCSKLRCIGFLQFLPCLNAVS